MRRIRMDCEQFFQNLDISKTLFVSDLDGTLLGKDAEFPKVYDENGQDIVARINRLGRLGVRFTFATARTIQSVRKILSGIEFNAQYDGQYSAPVALMNGVLIRDMKSEKYLSAEYIPRETAEQILVKIRDCGVNPFVYSLNGGQLVTAYAEPVNKYMRSFMDERIIKYGKPFTRYSKINDAAENDSVIYIVAIDKYDALLPLYNIVSGGGELKCAFYKDSYEPELWYLEMFSPTASKGAAVRRLREFTGAEKVVAFGDNGNDIPMFEESDFCAAVENASEEVKACADIVIGSAESGGVIDFTERMLNIK